MSKNKKVKKSKNVEIKSKEMTYKEAVKAMYEDANHGFIKGYRHYK